MEVLTALLTYCVPSALSYGGKALRNRQIFAVLLPWTLTHSLSGLSPPLEIAAITYNLWKRKEGTEFSALNN